MNQASDAPQTRAAASEAAKVLAHEMGLDLTQVVGSGKDGLIVKADVEARLADSAKTNIMDKQKLERHTLRETEAKNVPESVVALPSQAELVKIIEDMRGEIETLRESQAGLLDREAHSRDLTDEMFFISKPNGHRWEERRVVDGKTVGVEFVGTAFFGPFSDPEDIELYLEAKRAKREDAHLDWANVVVIKGHEARKLDQAEAAEREKEFASSAPVNVLDRRIFAQNHTGHTPGMGQIVGPGS